MYPGRLEGKAAQKRFYLLRAGFLSHVNGTRTFGWHRLVFSSPKVSAQIACLPEYLGLRLSQGHNFGGNWAKEFRFSFLSSLSRFNGGVGGGDGGGEQEARGTRGHRAGSVRSLLPTRWASKAEPATRRPWARLREGPSSLPRHSGARTKPRWQGNAPVSPELSVWPLAAAAVLQKGSGGSFLSSKKRKTET